MRTTSNNLFILSISTWAGLCEIPAVQGQNNPPTLAPIPNMTIPENAGPQVVALTGISSGSPDESQTLSVTALSSAPSIIATPIVAYTSPNPSGILTFLPERNANGVVTITVIINGGQPTDNTISQSFLVAVTPVNTIPVISDIGDQVTDENTPTVIAFTVRDVETPATDLSVSAHSSNQTLVPDANIFIGGRGTNRTVGILPAANSFGRAEVTLQVSD